MYAVDVICSNGHKFESWFQNRKSFEEQRDGSLISCPFCGDTLVSQALAAVRIGKHRERTDRSNYPEGIKAKSPAVSAKLLEIIEKSFEDVGNNFADEAIKIHFGESEKRNIRGIATPEEEKELASEGIPVFKLPDMQ